MKTSKPKTFFLLFLAALIGGGGLLTFILFLFRGSFNFVDLGLHPFQALLINAALCLVFFAQHSLMARKPFREWLKIFLPSPYNGAIYAVASGIAVIALVIFWQDSELMIFSVQGFVRLLFRGVFVLPIAGVVWTVFSLGFFVNFRVQSMVDDLRDRQSSVSLVTDRGPYRYIRHPLYLSSLLMIWSNPDLTLDRLLFNLVFTIWIVVAILLEERDLVSAFGDPYRSYQDEVPMLIPFRINLSIKNEPDMSIE
ncbi:MAG: hypothetical protein JSV42_02260 [Chloroflexota bacterium]|nr:MAG: hypothetical protein JSV42_02260 [Chloroflexota bacterium]